MKMRWPTPCRRWCWGRDPDHVSVSFWRRGKICLSAGKKCIIKKIVIIASAGPFAARGGDPCARDGRGALRVSDGDIFPEVDILEEDKSYRFVIVTGMSGGGKTQACRHLEDLGFFCIDNLPPVFIPKFFELCAHSAGHIARVVLVVDTRSREFFDTFRHVLEEMDKAGQKYELLFMEASDAAIIRRYKETRRRHPMAPSSRLSDGIKREREQLAPIREKATYIIDTSELRKVELKNNILRLFGNPDGVPMNINILSFGFKFGVPMDADMVLDVRFLPNPFYIDDLRHKSGAVPEVAEYIGKWPATQEFKKKLDDLLEFLIPQYVKEGKNQFVIAVGCTGGMHRSVYIARHIFDLLGARGWQATLEHRDLMKNDVKVHGGEAH